MPDDTYFDALNAGEREQTGSDTYHGINCDVCDEDFETLGAYLDHMNSAGACPDGDG